MPEKGFIIKIFKPDITELRILKKLIDKELDYIGCRAV